MIPGVSMGHLKEHKQGDLLSGFQSLFAGKAPESAAAGGERREVRGREETC